jgi:hypothetical protein
MPIELEARRSAETEIWVGGSVRGELELSVNGERVAAVDDQLNNDGQYVSLGRGMLRQGRNSLELHYTAGGWSPGAHAPQEPIGPLVLRPGGEADERILSVAPEQSAALCGRRLDWIELVRG